MSEMAPRSPTLSRSVAVSGAPPMNPVVGAGGDASRIVRRLGAEITNVWLPGLSWRVGRTGRPGLVGLALLGASLVFFFSTHLPVADEVRRLRSDLTEAETRAAESPPPTLSEPARALRNLPARTQMPQVLGTLLKQAEAAQLSIDTAKYEISATKAGALVRYRMSFPIDGPYPNVRRFIDATLIAIPALAIDDLSIARKSIADQAVEAQVRMSIFTRSTP
jgi:hypothetical protein